jgi:sulfite reductase (ferredoxin)
LPAACPIPRSEPQASGEDQNWMSWIPSDKPAVTLADSPIEEMSKNERIKVESQGLFFLDGGKHTFAAELDALSRGEIPTIGNEAKELSKFFGIYRQQVRGERGRKTGDQVFMARIKCPAGGELTAAQWAALDDAADLFADGTLRVTSRQGIQYHRVYGPKLAALVRHLNRHYREQATLSACGDVNRNVMASPVDGLAGPGDARARELAVAIAADLAPRSSSYFQIFLSDDAGRTVKPIHSDEPIYGRHYLPRKFKVGLAHADDNSVDVLTQDVGLVPVPVNGVADGSLWDLHSGGGLGQTHNNPHTAPLLGLYLGRVARGQVVDAVRAIAILQKEHGERRDRKLARWKYTIRRLGLDAVKKALRERFAIELADAAPQPLPPGRVHLGFGDALDGTSWYGVSVENGRIRPALRAAIREAVETQGLGVRLTPHQDVLLTGVRDRAALLAIFDRHGAARSESVSRARSLAIACPALPTCGLAMTHAENVLPSYLDAIEQAGLGDVDLEIRMTGCPNHCARPPSAEVGIFGYGKNDHVLLAGGARNGSRLARPLYARISGQQIVPALIGLFRAAKERCPTGKSPGDWLAEQDFAELRGWIGVEGAG